MTPRSSGGHGAYFTVWRPRKDGAAAGVSFAALSSPATEIGT